jgi:predicted negative regulator of RcsB-dependent stress response
MLMAKQPEELRAALDEGLRLDSSFFTAHVHMSFCAIALGDRVILDGQAAELERLGMGHFALLMESLFCFAQVDFAGALRAARKLRTSRLVRFQHEAFLREAMVFAEAGRMDLATRALRQALALPREVASTRQRAATLIGLAYCTDTVGGAYSHDWVEEAISLRPGPTMLTHAAILSSRARRTGEAATYLNRLREFPPVAVCKFGEALAAAEALSASGNLKRAAEQRNLAAGFTAPYHASPQATSASELARLRVQKQGYAAALQWVDPFLPELGAWGRGTRAIEVPATDTSLAAQKVLRFQTAMRTLSSDPQPFVQQGEPA